MERVSGLLVCKGFKLEAEMCGAAASNRELGDWDATLAESLSVDGVAGRRSARVGDTRQHVLDADCFTCRGTDEDVVALA